MKLRNFMESLGFPIKHLFLFDSKIDAPIDNSVKQYVKKHLLSGEWLNTAQFNKMIDEIDETIKRWKDKQKRGESIELVKDAFDGEKWDRRNWVKAEVMLAGSIPSVLVKAEKTLGPKNRCFLNSVKYAKNNSCEVVIGFLIPMDNKGAGGLSRDAIILHAWVKKDGEHIEVTDLIGRQVKHFPIKTFSNFSDNDIQDEESVYKIARSVGASVHEALYDYVRNSLKEI